MRFFVFKRQTLLLILFGIIVFIGGLILLTGEIVSASSATRQLPIYAVATDEKKIAITFDAAWTNQDTEELIEILAKHNAKATFFVVGDWAKSFPESVKAFYDAGHTIANHSDTHKAFSKCSRKEIKEEIDRINRTNISPTKEINEFLEKKGSTPLSTGIKLAELIRRPELTYEELAPCDKNRPEMKKLHWQQAEIEIKYEGYIKELLEEARVRFSPMLRNLEYEYPNQGLQRVKDEFLLGKDLLVAPVTAKGMSKRKVVLPKGDSWKYVPTGEIYEGGQTVEVDSPLETLPYFERIK